MFAELDWPRLREWEDAATAGGDGLVWERYAGRIPRDVLVTLLPVFTNLFVDVPLGGLETAPARWEISGYDQWYETLDRAGRGHHLVVLRAPDGTVVGLSEAAWDARAPGIVRQQLTAVARPWRGRGVARALKAAMLRQVHDAHPEAVVISTNNAEVGNAAHAVDQRACGLQSRLAERGLSGDARGAGCVDRSGRPRRRCRFEPVTAPSWSKAKRRWK